MILHFESFKVLLPHLTRRPSITNPSPMLAPIVLHPSVDGLLCQALEDRFISDPFSGGPVATLPVYIELQNKQPHCTETYYHVVTVILYKIKCGI